MTGVPRMMDQSSATNPDEGKVVWSPMKSLWFSGMALVGIVAGPLTFSWNAVLVSFGFTVITLCLGHTLGLHRLLIHRSFSCHRWLEYVLVHLGVVVGMGGPFRILYMHDIRDWSQRHRSCHPFFVHQSPSWKDFVWQMHCEIELKQPPIFCIESRVADDPVYRLMQRTWMLQQLPWALLMFALGGIGFVVWGVAIRVSVSLIGHWMVGYLAHNIGERAWQVDGHAIQGHNVTGIGLLTMGECWHNNHHAFPDSAKLGLEIGQWDPGWWALCALRVCGLVWDLKQPNDLPPREEVHRLQRANEAPQHLP